MPKLTIDGIEIEVPAGATVLQACELAGAEIPRFCYHERLSIAGNCRMCLVEMEKAPKPIASCAMPAADNMVILTGSAMVKKARRGVMEFLLINHPLDCPICDQGGECDLQDQAMGYGYDRSRYHENKRAVKDKNLGPLVKTFMNRCIHCTRCIRFATEIAGVPELGATGRGENMEVGTYIAKALSSELSGNIVDICPVGALVSKPYSFNARPWELRKTESIDVFDAVGSNIRVDSRGPEVLRVLPRLNEAINEEWLADKSRHAIDGLRFRRLDRPYIRDAHGKLIEASWDAALGLAAQKLQATAPQKIAVIAGDLIDVEALYAAKSLFASLGITNLECRQDGAKLDAAARAGYVFNTMIAGIEQSDACLIIGANPRWEAPLVNARIRKRSRQGPYPIGVIGPQTPLTYSYAHLGEDPRLVATLPEQQDGFAKILREAKRPMLILGQAALARPDGAAILHAARAMAENFGMIQDGWNGFNVLHHAAARVGALDLGFVPGAGGRDLDGILHGAASGAIELVYLLGADEIAMDRLGAAFVIYQGHHGDAGAARADIVLPGAAYTEKNALYVNLEGRVQEARLSHLPLGDAREDWKILRALSAKLGRDLAFNTLSELRARLVETHPHFGKIGEIVPASWGEFGAAGEISAAPFVLPINDYYRTDPISRASPTMQACSTLYVDGEAIDDRQELAATYG